MAKAGQMDEWLDDAAVARAKSPVYVCWMAIPQIA
jgi:hypothetical protein